MPIFVTHKHGVGGFGIDEIANDGTLPGPRIFVSQSNSGINENGNWFHSADNPRTGETTTTITDKKTGKTTVTVHPMRHR